MNHLKPSVHYFQDLFMSAKVKARTRDAADMKTFLDEMCAGYIIKSYDGCGSTFMFGLASKLMRMNDVEYMIVFTVSKDLTIAEKYTHFSYIVVGILEFVNDCLELNDYHMRIVCTDIKFEVQIVYGDDSLTGPGDHQDRCPSCSYDTKEDRQFLLKKFRDHHAWLDAQKEQIVVITPKEHIESYNDCVNGEMFSMFSTAYREYGHTRSSFGEKRLLYMKYIILDHGNYRNWSHLNLKIVYEDIAWPLLVENHASHILPPIMDSPFIYESPPPAWTPRLRFLIINSSYANDATNVRDRSFGKEESTPVVRSRHNQKSVSSKKRIKSQS